MSENETTLEDKIFAISLLIFCFCFGYWTRSEFGIFGTSFNLEISIVLIDGLIRIIAVCIGCLLLIGMILMYFDTKIKE